MSWLSKLPINVPTTWSERWFSAFHRDVILRLGRQTVELKTTGQASLPPLTADPANLEDGDIWLNATDGKLRARIGGVTVDLN